MPGSPLAALSQLRSAERAGWEGWVTEVERGGESEMEKSSRGHLPQCATCVLLFFAAHSVTHRFSWMIDQEL